MKRQGHNHNQQIMFDDVKIDDINVNDDLIGIQTKKVEIDADLQQQKQKQDVDNTNDNRSDNDNTNDNTSDNDNHNKVKQQQKPTTMTMSTSTWMAALRSMTSWSPMATSRSIRATTLT